MEILDRFLRSSSGGQNKNGATLSQTSIALRLSFQPNLRLLAEAQ
jgi:hypothetical protein